MYGASSALSRHVKSTARRRVRRLTQDLRVDFLLAISTIVSPRGDVEFQEKSGDWLSFQSHSSCMRSLPDAFRNQDYVFVIPRNFRVTPRLYALRRSRSTPLVVVLISVLRVAFRTSGE